MLTGRDIPRLDWTFPGNDQLLTFFIPFPGKTYLMASFKFHSVPDNSPAIEGISKNPVNAAPLEEVSPFCPVSKVKKAEEAVISYFDQILDGAEFTYVCKKKNTDHSLQIEQLQREISF